MRNLTPLAAVLLLAGCSSAPSLTTQQQERLTQIEQITGSLSDGQQKDALTEADVACAVGPGISTTTNTTTLSDAQRDQVDAYALTSICASDWATPTPTPTIPSGGGGSGGSGDLPAPDLPAPDLPAPDLPHLGHHHHHLHL